MNKIFSYVVVRDYGFAPNPFGGYCTLATCKPGIRKAAKKGDWVVGLGRKDFGSQKIIFAMKVTDITTFDQYWMDDRFQYKKPILNGSLKQTYGDNIYHHEDGRWIQEDSHHSFEGGKVNMLNLRTDTGTTDKVLISDDFYYWGKDAIDLPDEIFETIKIGRGFRSHFPEETVDGFLDWISGILEKGNLATPESFTKFERFAGEK